MAKKYWTNKEIAALKNWAVGENPNRQEICQELKRTWHSVRSKLNELQLPYPKETKRIEKEKKEDKRIVKLQEQIKTLIEQKQINIHNFFDKRVRIGIVSDTHIGSLYQRLDILEAAYETFAKEGIRAVYHAGDLCEGEKMHRGQEYEIYAHGADAQIKEVIEKYPRREGITTYFISGSHDLSFWRHSGVDVGTKIAEYREDMVYLGKETADVVIGREKRAIKLRLVHPSKGTAYALSYHPQKYVESLSGGQNHTF